MIEGKDYADMIREQHRLVRSLPLGMTWEFIPRPTQSTIKYESEDLALLSRMNHWQLAQPVRQLINQSHWALIVTDTQEIIQYVNEQFQQMTGYDRAESMGRRPKFLQGPETDPATRHRIRMAVDQRQPIKEMMVNYRKNGSMYWCEFSLFPVHNDQQQLVNFIAFEQEMAI